jgi:CubicO group peptidase (beta-lactamase class C family)
MRTIISISIALFISVCLNAQIGENQKLQIDSLFVEWDNNSPGCALGIIKNGELTYSRGYGMANLEYDIPNTDTSVFRIASTSKQFTAACIILLAQKGRLNLDDKLIDFYPEFPKYANQITIRHLLNHTSGIRDYIMIAYLVGLGDEGYFEDRDVMRWLINQKELNFQPGDEYLYSNSGYWLLGQIVGKVSGMNLADFAEKEIFAPLEMNNTHFHNDHTKIVRNRASGYIPDDNDNYKISMTKLNMIGDGGIFTTIKDIKKWDDAFYNSKILSSNFWSKMLERGILNNGDTIEYASGLFVGSHKGLHKISHSGGFVGFRSDIIRFPDQRITVAVFTNRGDANPTSLGYNVAKILLQDKLIDEEPILSKKTEKLDLLETTELASSQLIGKYEHRPAIYLQISLNNDSLHVEQSWDKSSYVIEKKSTNSYQVVNSPNITLNFSDLKNGFSQHLKIKQKGSSSEWKRIKDIDTSNIILKEYLGSYYSTELDIKYLISIKGDILKVTVGSNESVELNVYDLDEFSYYNRLIRFKRKDGLINGFELDAGRVNNLKFEKRN